MIVGQSGRCSSWDPILKSDGKRDLRFNACVFLYFLDFLICSCCLRTCIMCIWPDFRLCQIGNFKSFPSPVRCQRHGASGTGGNQFQIPKSGEKVSKA
jgi:hypothetical protein